VFRDSLLTVRPASLILKSTAFQRCEQTVGEDPSRLTIWQRGVRFVLDVYAPAEPAAEPPDPDISF